MMYLCTTYNARLKLLQYEIYRLTIVTTHHLYTLYWDIDCIGNFL